ncbi:hypothetical protein [Marispirochaeta aestuarii]|uniref:hypothetical protein n=1 Tax=Marispirochaeta aestuarii TaxID=1963862 RepID=UPI001178061E|nr:hypothetical protein [Marispirochaeta aestuarii]
MKFKCLKIICLLIVAYSSMILHAQAKLSGLKVLTASKTTEISQYGITWTFSEPVFFGTYITGDYWVVGPVTIESVSPAPGTVTANGVTRFGNGSMINPMTGNGQAYDENANGWNASKVISFPITLFPGQSIVSTESISDFRLNSDGQIETVDGKKPSLNHCSLWSAAVLTCVSEEQTANTFRPPFVGDDKPVYSADNLNFNLLPQLSPTNSAPSNIDYYSRLIQRPWITHNTDWLARSIHPAMNMPSYHREVVSNLSTIATLLLTEGIQNEDLVLYAIQNGIDWYHMCILGNGDSAFIEWPVLFAGLMLGDNTILSAFTSGSNKTLSRSVDKTYYWSDHHSSISSSIVTAGNTWTSYSRTPIPFWRQSSTNGSQEHEHLDPSEWDLVSDGGGGKREVYRVINSRAWLGVGFSAIVLGIKNEWDHPAYFDYLDRWMRESGSYIKSLYSSADPEDYQCGNSDFVTDMWNEYRNNY